MELVILLAAIGLLFYLWSRIGELEHRIKTQEELIGEILGEVRGGFLKAAPVAKGPMREAAKTEAADGAGGAEIAPLATGAPARPAEPATSPERPPLSPAARAGTVPAEPAAAATGPRLRSDPAPARAGERVLAPRSDEPRRGLEERIGTQWAVWVGGLALALGAVLLVRYSIEAGFFGPAARIALGAVLAVMLAIAGEWLRRAGGKSAAVPVADIPAILTASATIAAFATAYAAHALYDFIGAGPAFLLMGAVGLVTLCAAMVHGPALAGLGLAASLATPLLVTAGPIVNPWPVVVYLFAVAVAAFALARTKGWLWLAAAAGGGAILWGLALVGKADGNVGWWAPAMLHTILQMVVAAVALAVLVPAQVRDGEEERDVLGAVIFAGFGLLVIAVVIANDGLSWASMAFAALSIAVLAFVGRSRPGLSAVAAVAGAVLVAFAIDWPGAVVGRTIERLTWHEWIFPVPILPWSYATFVGIAALLVALVSVERMLRRPHMAMWAQCVHAGVAVALPLVVLVLANERLTHALTSMWGAAAAAVVAVLFGAGALRFQTEEKSHPVDVIRLGTGVLAAGGVVAVVLALIYALERGYLTVALAGAAFAMALVAEWKRIPVLRSAVGAIGVLVLARIVWDPLIMGADVGGRPLLNWLLLGYGVPALAFFGAARLLERERTDSNSGLADALALLFAGLLVFMQIRHGLHGPAAMLKAAPNHLEQGLMALMAFGGSYALMQLRGLRANPVFRAGSIILAAIATASSVVALGLINNPVLVSGELVQGHIALNSLMLGYLLPGAMAGWLAWNARGAERPEWLITLVAMASAGLLIGFLLLELRFHFHGADMRYLKGAGHVEMGLMLALVLAALLVLTGIAMMRKTDAVSMVTLVVTAVAVVMLLGGLGFNANPMITGEAAAGPAFLGSIAAAYLLPAIAAAALAWHAREPWPRGYMIAMGAVALIAVFGWLSLSVRHLFQGPVISYARPTSEMEIWAYSAAWLAMGLVLLGYGMVRGVVEARAASAVFVVVTVLKVFLLDLAGLTGFWRAISFIGLGLVLMGIGLAYQRVLLGQGKATGGRPQAAT